MRRHRSVHPPGRRHTRRRHGDVRRFPRRGGCSEQRSASRAPSKPSYGPTNSLDRTAGGSSGLPRRVSPEENGPAALVRPNTVQGPPERTHRAWPGPDPVCPPVAASQPDRPSGSRPDQSFRGRRVRTVRRFPSGRIRLILPPSATCRSYTRARDFGWGGCCSSRSFIYRIAQSRNSPSEMRFCGAKGKAQVDSHLGKLAWAKH